MTIADASPFIGLSRVGQLDLLGRVCGEVAIPPAVRSELGDLLRPWPAWLTVRAPAGPLPSVVQRTALGSGEREVIALALETTPAAVVLDEWLGRALARRLGLPVIGTVRVLLLAKERGHLDAVRPWLDALVREAFRIAPDLYEAALAEAGEQGY